MKYTKEVAQEIYKTLFGTNTSMSGQSALSSYRNMMKNIQLNYANEVETKSKKLNEMIMPYYEDIKANPNKIL